MTLLLDLRKTVKPFANLVMPLRSKLVSCLKKSFMQEGKTKSVIVKILPCHQQRDSYECGMFSIANAVSLAFGYLPSDMRYIGSLRAQLLEK